MQIIYKLVELVFIFGDLDAGVFVLPVSSELFYLATSYQFTYTGPRLTIQPVQYWSM